MSELCFFQSLTRCFKEQQNCTKCPLYGHDECRQTLINELIRHKRNAIQEEERRAEE